MNLIEEVLEWTEHVVINDKEESLGIASGYIVQLVSYLKDHPDTSKEVGPLIGKVKGLQKRIQGLEPIEWVRIGSGELAVGHRPGNKMLRDLKLQGATHLLTLLSNKEGARDIATQAAKEDLDWIHFPMESAKAPDTLRFEELRLLFGQMKEALEDKARIYIHCSAGIHRTGMITHAFFRYLGMTTEESKEMLGKLRQETSEGVGEERLAFAELFLSDQAR